MNKAYLSSYIPNWGWSDDRGGIPPLHHWANLHVVNKGGRTFIVRRNYEVDAS